MTGADELYQLLPAHLRRLDEDAGGALRALCAVLAEPHDRLRADLVQLYENFFVETAEEWAVPYLGDLLGVRGLHDVPGRATGTQRARVADTLAARRRKGTVAMLEQLARDATGWPAKAVEFFELLSATQNVNHLRPHRTATADLRDPARLELVDTAFDPLAHTVDVRHVGDGPGGERGRYDIPHVGLFVWPIGAAWLDRATARPVTDPPDGRWTVDPTGLAEPLLMPPAPEEDLDQLAGEDNVPGQLRALPLHAELTAYRAAFGGPVPPAPPAHFGGRPVLRVWTQPTAADPLTAVDPRFLHMCDLADGATGDWRRPAAGQVPVDVARGRVAFPAGTVPHRVAVSSAYGTAGGPFAVGAGSHPRRDGLAELLDRPVGWQAAVSVEEPADGLTVFDSLAAAVAAWNAVDTAQPGRLGVISILDSHRYPGALTGAARIRVGAGSRLVIVAAEWPRLPVRGGAPGETVRLPGRIEPVGLRPCVVGDVEVLGTAGPDAEPGSVALDGVLLDGRVTVTGLGAANLGRLELRHCSVVPAAGGVRVTAGNPRLTVQLVRSVCGPLDVPATVRRVVATGSVLQAPAGWDAPAVDAVAAEAELTGCTVLGRTRVQELSASDTLFAGRVTVQRRQGGCVRFSYLPADSSTPRRYRCQPDLAVAAGTGPAGRTRARLVPAFLSERFGAAGFGLPGPDTAPELLTGAADGTEIGAYGAAGRPQRLANLTTALDDYLALGLEAAALPVLPGT